MFRYYLTQRPPMPGAVPKHPGMIVEDYGCKKCVDGSIYAYGHVDYPMILPERERFDYELIEGYGGNVCG